MVGATCTSVTVLVPVALVPLLLLPSVTVQSMVRLVWLPPPVGSPLAGGEAVGDRAERRLVVGDARAAAQRQHAGQDVVAAGDAVLAGEVQRVAADEAADRDGGAGEGAAAVG